VDNDKTKKTRGPGRPSIGHEGHPGRADRCAACQLRRWREARGLTQAEAANMIPSGRNYHTPLRTYTSWERAEVSVPVHVLLYVAQLDGAGSARPSTGRQG